MNIIKTIFFFIVAVVIIKFIAKKIFSKFKCFACGKHKTYSEMHTPTVCKKCINKSHEYEH